MWLRNSKPKRNQNLRNRRITENDDPSSVSVSWLIETETRASWFHLVSFRSWFETAGPNPVSFRFAKPKFQAKKSKPFRFPRFRFLPYMRALILLLKRAKYKNTPDFCLASSKQTLMEIPPISTMANGEDLENLVALLSAQLSHFPPSTTTYLHLS